MPDEIWRHSTHTGLKSIKAASPNCPPQVLWICRQRMLTWWKMLERFPSWTTSTLLPGSFFLRYSGAGKTANVHIWQTDAGNGEIKYNKASRLFFQSESLMTSYMKDIGQVRFDTSCCWRWHHLTLQLCQWSGVVSDLKSGAGSAWRVLPGLVQADPGPALPHDYGARSGGAEELQHQRQVSLWSFTVS